jgi:hypothetical protein
MLSFSSKESVVKIRFILPVIAVSLACSLNGLAAESYDDLWTKEEVNALAPVEHEAFLFLMQRAMSAKDTDKSLSDDANVFCDANVNIGDMHQFELLSNITSEINKVIPNDFKMFESISSFVFQNIQARKSENVEKVKLHSNYVSIISLDGCAFHVAEYSGVYGKYCVITFLNGDFVGHQVIAENGVLRAKSTNVEWYDNYFIHYYTDGVVISYENSQIILIYQ